MRLLSACPRTLACCLYSNYSKFGSRDFPPLFIMNTIRTKLGPPNDFSALHFEKHPYFGWWRQQSRHNEGFRYLRFKPVIIDASSASFVVLNIDSYLTSSFIIFIPCDFKYEYTLIPSLKSYTPASNAISSLQYRYRELYYAFAATICPVSGGVFITGVRSLVPKNPQTLPSFPLLMPPKATEPLSKPSGSTRFSSLTTLS
jgi:hypothetical protein